MQPEKMVLKEKNKKGSFLMKLRCRTDLLASIFPSCVLVYFLPIFLSSAGLFVGLKKIYVSKNTMQLYPLHLQRHTCDDTYKHEAFFILATQYSNRKQTSVCSAKFPPFSERTDSGNQI